MVSSEVNIIAFTVVCSNYIFILSIVSGFMTKQECDSWPVEKCSVKKVKVIKTTPDTSCREVARELCAPKGCAEKQVSRFRAII